MYRRPILDTIKFLIRYIDHYFDASNLYSENVKGVKDLVSEKNHDRILSTQLLTEKSEIHDNFISDANLENK
jgi:hypothetical protein